MCEITNKKQGVMKLFFITPLFFDFLFICLRAKRQF